MIFLGHRLRFLPLAFLLHLESRSTAGTATIWIISGLQLPYFFVVHVVSQNFMN